MEAIEITGCELVKCGEYYYLRSAPVDTMSVPNTPDIDQPASAALQVCDSLSVPDLLRSKTPDSRPRAVEKSHRRSTSACVFTSSVPPVSSVPQGNTRGKRRGSTPPTQYPPVSHAFTSNSCLSEPILYTHAHMTFIN